MSDDANADEDATAGSVCPSCGKPAALCVCSALRPAENRVFLLILQHPQEQDRELGTAGLAVRQFRNARLRIGLSWPNLAAALGRDADPRRWGVLYLGSVQPAAAAAAGRAVIAVDRKGEPLPGQEAVLAALDGLILLDGSWSQAKALWWRNPWLLKSQRLVLDPRIRSAYGRYRREPRPDAVSTLEAAGLALADLEGRPGLADAAVGVLRLLVEKYAAAGKPGEAADAAAPPSAARRRAGPKRPGRRRRW